LPSHRGRGLAAALVGAVIAGIEAGGARAFLHVVDTNHGAIRLYEQLGFRVRQSATILVTRPGPTG
jgi:predicted GNAT family acetyltransferase